MKAIDSVTETHVSWATLIDDRAYKQKQPVRTELLDFSTVDRRRFAAPRRGRARRLPVYAP